MRTLRRLSIPLTIACVALFAGCDGGEDFSPTDPGGQTPPPPPAPAPPPSNATADGAVERLIWSIEQQDESVYETLLTGDFRFEFSESSDPDLMQEFPSGWVLEDEAGSVARLFDGGENEEGVVQPEATAIDVDFGQTKTEPLPGSPGSGATERLLRTPIAMTIQTIATPENPQGLRYRVSDQSGFVFHQIEIVRGDVAQGLSAGQPADDAHWYLRRWVGQEPIFGAPGSVETDARTGDEESLTTWGRLKRLYR